MRSQISKKTKMSNSTTVIIALSVLLAISIALGVTLAYFSNNQTATGNVTLGDPVTISMTQGGSTVTTLTFAGTAMPGTIYDQPIAVAAPANTSDAVLRGKLTMQLDAVTTADIEAGLSTDWTAGTDDYYYYNGVITAGTSVEFVQTITVPTTLTNDAATNVYVISVQVEALQHANSAATSVWTTAPAQWITDYGSGTIPTP
ncbi:MAG: hypothetical protein PHP83_02450 [Clostridia bacterium]|nr:hypothetical protein [Clostridia bacterium]